MRVRGRVRVTFHHEAMYKDAILRVRAVRLGIRFLVHTTDVGVQRHVVERQLVLSGRHLLHGSQQRRRIEQSGQPNTVRKLECSRPVFQLRAP